MMGQMYLVFYDSMEIGNESIVRDGVKQVVSGVKPGV